MNKLLHLIYICALTSPLIISSCLESAESPSAKQQQWEELSRQVDTWTDKLYHPIDSGIKETVIALNILGISTVQSCEGHLDWGYPHPWIDLNTDPKSEIASLQQQCDKLYEQILQEVKQLEEKYPNLSFQEQYDLPEMKPILALRREQMQLYDTIRTKEQESLKSLYAYLEQFYQSRPHSYDRMLIVTNNRLQSVEADQQAIRSDAEKKDTLVKYQEEMRNFGTFLKDKFFEEISPTSKTD